MATKQKKKLKPKGPLCQIGWQLCNGQGVHLRTGMKKGDPVFNCCLACWAYLKNLGVRTKQASAADANSKNRI